MRYFIYGYYGFGNFGDDLMLSAIVHQIAARDATARFTVKCRVPVQGLGPHVEFLTAETILEAPQPAWRRGLRYLGALFQALRGHDWLVIGGGALFLDKGALNKSLVLLWCLVVRARLMGLRVAVVGVSCDLLASPASLWLTRSIFRRAQVVTVRDQFSYDYARYFGCRDVRLCADLAFASPQLTADSAAAVQARRLSREKIAGKSRIGVCLVDYFAVYEPDAVRRQAFVERAAASLLKHAAEAEYVYISLQEGQGLGDDRVHAALAEKVVFAGYRSVQTLAEALDLCAELDGMLTMRYHLGLLGAALGMPVAALCHELKLVSVALMPGVIAVGLPQFAAGEAADPVGDLLAVRSPLPGQLDMGALRRRAIANFDWLP
jgi:polysaccharide pyruvyl transferase WcaK-like protein